MKKKQSILTVLHKIYFLQQLVKFGNFKTTASNLDVTPSAITQAIKSLEKYFEQTLVIRQNGQVFLTTEGSQILEKITPFLIDIDNLDKQYAKDSNPKQIRIGTFSSLGIRFLPDLYDQFIKLDSNLKINIQIGRTQELLTLIHQGHLDIALVVDAPESDSYYSKIIGYNNFSVFTHKKNIINGKIDSKTGLGCISSRQDGRQSFLTKALTSLNLKSSDFNVQADSLEILLSLCLKGKITALLPLYLANQYSDQLTEVNHLFNAIQLKEKTKHPLSLVTRTSFSNKWREEIENYFEKI